MFEKIREDYDKEYNDALNKTGLFWAFDRKQFDENKTHNPVDFSHFP